MIPFIDVSSNNGQIDWPTAAAYLLKQDPNAGAIVKVSEGTDYVNELLDQQRWGSHAWGLTPIGLYHCGRPSTNSGHAEAEYFLKAIGDDGGMLKGEFLCLDLEDDKVPADAPLQAYVDDFRDVITRALGIHVLVYSGEYYLPPHGVKIDSADYWCAAPGAANAPTCAMWQYDWHGRIPGISTDVDLDYLLTPIDQFRTAFCWGFQPDPLAGRTASGTPDLDKSTAVLAVVKHVIAKLEQSPPDVPTAIADLAQWVTTNGLIGS